MATLQVPRRIWGRTGLSIPVIPFGTQGFGNHFGDVGDDAAAQTIPGLVVYRFYGPLLFANVRFFIERLEHFIARETHPVRQVIIDARSIPGSSEVLARARPRSAVGSSVSFSPTAAAAA